MRTFSPYARFLLAVAGALLIPCEHGRTAQPGGRWATYTNARFGYSVAYPADLLKPGPEPANGDGRRFTGIKNARRAATSLIVLVFGALNTEDEPLKTHFARAAAGDSPSQKTTYKKLGPGWYVVSGFISDPDRPKRRRIFYRKTILREDVLKTLHLEYDPSEKAGLDPVVTRISRSFRG
jgi:hypothetical protein